MMRARLTLTAGGMVVALAASLAAVWTGAAGGGTPRAAAAEPVVVETFGFEDGTAQGWTGRAAETVAPTTAAARTGTRGLAVSGRTASWQGPSRDVLTTLTAGTRYTFSVWARLAAGEPTTQLRMSLERRWQGTAASDQIVGNVTVTAAAWVQLTGSYVLADDARVVHP